MSETESALSLLRDTQESAIERTQSIGGGATEVMLEEVAQRL